MNETSASLASFHRIVSASGIHRKGVDARGERQPWRRSCRPRTRMGATWQQRDRVSRRYCAAISARTTIPSP